MLASQHHLRIENNVTREYQCPERGVDKIQNSILDEDSQNSENQQDQDANKQNASACCKIPLRLEGEDRQTKTNNSADTSSH